MRILAVGRIFIVLSAVGAAVRTRFAISPVKLIIFPHRVLVFLIFCIHRTRQPQNNSTSFHFPQITISIAFESYEMHRATSEQPNNTIKCQLARPIYVDIYLFKHIVAPD